jgi:glycosyltransferase involved in cell wall biosynthesis
LAPGSGQGGIESAVTYLLRALGRLDDGDEEYVLVAHPEHTEWLEALATSNMQVVTSPAKVPTPPKPLGPFRPLAHKLRSTYVKVAWRDPWLTVPGSRGFYESLACDVIHFPYQVYVRCDLPTVFSPHDLQHVHFRKFFTPQDYAWRQNTFRTAFQEATVVVGSSWVKRDILEHFDVSGDRIQVIPWAAPVDDATVDEQQVTATVSKHGLPERFCIYPAMTWPHKNHLRLLEALSALRSEGITVNLVCTGHQNDHWPAIEAKIRELDLGEQVRFLGLVPRDELRALYRAADFVVVPTLFEAASGPVFEGWAEGTPIACSTVTSLPEQVGDAGVLFDPYSVPAIAAAIKSLHTDEVLRRKLVEAGARRLADFSWDRTARAYRSVYRRSAGLPLSAEEREILSTDWMAER